VRSFAHMPLGLSDRGTSHATDRADKRWLFVTMIRPVTTVGHSWPVPSEILLCLGKFVLTWNKNKIFPPPRNLVKGLTVISRHRRVFLFFPQSAQNGWSRRRGISKLLVRGPHKPLHNSSRAGHLM